MRSLTLCFSIVAFLGGCSLAPEIPRHFSVDDSFVNDVSSPDPSFDEVAVIGNEAPEAWNAVCREYLGYNCLVYDGLVNVPGGFTLEAFSDNRHVVYRGVEDANYWTMAASAPYGTNGYGTWEDVILYSFHLAVSYTLDASTGSVSVQPATSDNYRKEFSRTAIHEFGHFLGLPHITDDPKSLMYVKGASSDSITPRDIQAFCRTHTCLKDAPRS